MLLITRNSAKVLGAAIILLLIASRATAQGVIVSPYGPPTGGYYYPSPTISGYVPPGVSYYYPAPTVTYYVAPAVNYYPSRVAYYPTPSVSYYAAPVGSYTYYPGPVTTTTYGHFGHPRVTTYYYPAYIPR